MHVIKLNVKKKNKKKTANEKVPTAHQFKNVKQNLVTLVMNISTHIKTLKILSRIVTKPTKWQVHPAKTQRSMGGCSG